ncbi:hypothetical protein M5K25_024001 [Dendrobium thyrsiflorum]|uniref:Uncharacterized protein n=1 Tax=Dendrobium thyrsiflorum TaxID=117978 RepID=A0ABD0U192_DENTH
MFNLDDICSRTLNSLCCPPNASTGRQKSRLRASPTERQTCVCRRSIAPAERQFFRHLLAGEQCDANIGVALFTHAIYLFQPDLPKKRAKDG